MKLPCSVPGGRRGRRAPGARSPSRTRDEGSWILAPRLVASGATPRMARSPLLSLLTCPPPRARTPHDHTVTETYTRATTRPDAPR